MWTRPRFDSNEDLVDSLVRREALRNSKVEKAFRSVDRANFVDSEDRAESWSDAPHRNADTNLHLSAPHIYVTAAQALDLEEGLSFLNIGSGSGYFSAIVSTILGPTAISHGVEIRSNLVEFSRRATQNFLDTPLSSSSSSSSSSNNRGDDDDDEEEEDTRKRRRRTSSCSSQSSVCAETRFFEGDIFKLNMERNIKYDRIYVGAEAVRCMLFFLLSIVSHIYILLTLAYSASLVFETIL